MRPSLAQRFLLAICIGAAAACVGAETYPSRPITLIAPFAAGGSADGIARVLARKLGDELGQPVIVDNRPGAGGASGLMLLAKSKPDGYTIGMGATGAIAIGPHLPDAPPLRPGEQLQPLAKIADIPLVLVTGANSDFTDLRSLLAKAAQTEEPTGNAGQYTAHHLSAELLASSARLKLPPVPYKGSAPAVMDVMGGQVPLAVVDLTSVAGQLKAGTIKALAVTSSQRSKLAPEIPTMAEAGVPGYAAPAWMGLFAPKGLPAPIREKLGNAIETALADPATQARIVDLAAEPAYMGSSQFGTFIDAESERWARVIAGLPKAEKQ